MAAEQSRGRSPLRLNILKRSPRKEVRTPPSISWISGSTGSPSPSPGSRRAERCRMDVLSCSRAASDWALKAWQNSRSLSALCDLEHGIHSLIQVNMYDRPRTLPPGNPIAFDPVYTRSNCYLVLWDTTKEKSLQQALKDLSEIRKRQSSAAILLLGCDLEQDDTVDISQRQHRQQSNLEKLVTSDESCTGSLTMYFANAPADVEAAILQLIFKSLLSNIDPSFFAQHEWIAAFHGSEILLQLVWATVGQQDMELCLEAVIEGLDYSLKLRPRPSVQCYLDLAAFLIERGAPGEHLGVMSKMHPMAVEEIIHHLRQLSNHTLNLSWLNLPILNGSRLTAIAPLLHRIDVSHNRLERLPLEIFQLPNIVNIKASHNKLQVLPAYSRWLCLGLCVLDVSFNELICPADSQDYNNFVPFQSTGDTSATSIGKALPGLVGSPTTASDLFTKSVFLTKTGSQTTTTATSARPTNRRFSAIPPSVQKMKNLASINLRGNYLQEIPVWVTLLPKLWALDIRDNNQLHRLPPELARCRSLYLVQVEGLQLVNPPMSEVKRGSTAVICYLRSQLKASIPYNQLKLMLVGEAGVGKTTLLSCLSGGKIPKDNLATVGIVMSSFYLSDRRKQNTRRIKFHCLDFAGQHEYDSTHQCFITHRAIYLGLFNVCHGLSGLRSLRPWLMSIQACAPSSPVILVGTHLDKLQDSLDKDDFVAMASQECGLGQQPSVSAAVGLPPVLSLHFVTATSQSVAMQHLQDTIYDLALKLQDMRSTFRQPYLEQAIPACYLALQDRLAVEIIALADSNRCPVLTHNELLTLVQRDPPLDIEDSEELAQACRFLHEAGIILHFESPRRPVADSLYFLQPQWLSDALARIVTTPERSLAIKGLLSVSHLPLVFKDLLVPRLLYGRFLELLEAFEMLVPLDTSKTVHLVPALLPKEPSNLPVIDARRCMVRIYRLAFIPAGLWSRLIARLVNFFHLQPTEESEEDKEDGPDAIASKPSLLSRLLMRKECTLDRRVIRRRRRIAVEQKQHTKSGVSTQPQALDSNSRPPSGSTSPECFFSQLSTSASGNHRTITIVANSSNDRLQEILGKRPKWHCWKTGGVFYLPTGKDIPAGVMEEYVLVQELTTHGEMAIFVQANNKATATTVLARTILQVDTLLEEWYPGLCEYPCEVGQFVPCSSCLLLASQMSGPLTSLCSSAHSFSIEQCLAMVEAGEDMLVCQLCCEGQKLVDIVPDLVLADLPSHCLVSNGQDGALFLDRDPRNCLGKGAFGEVFGGFWHGSSAAVKLLLPIDETGSQRTLRDMYHLLRDEADILAHLQHPTIVKLLGVCLSPPGVVMELAPGGNLRGAIRDANGLPLPVVHHVIRQVAEGLSYLHDRNIIYRDLKPDNVLVWSLNLRNGVEVKLADYSLAKFASSSGQLLQTKGTEGYMAPEVACGSDRRLTYDCKADIFAVGVLLFECVCAKRPFWELNKWKFLEYVEEGAYPSLEKGLEGCGDERSICRKSGTIDTDPLCRRFEASLDFDEIESYDNISLGSLSSLSSFWAASDPGNSEGTLILSSRTGSVLFVKAQDMTESDCVSENSHLVEDDKYHSEDLCHVVCLQPLLERCLCARPEVRPSSSEISLQLACCSGVRDTFGCSRYRSEMRLLHFTAVPKSCEHDSRGPISMQLFSCGSRQSGLLRLNVPTMVTSTFHLDSARNAEWASVLSGSGARLSAITSTSLLSDISTRGYLVWLGTLSGHILIFNPGTLHLEARLQLPATVVCFCPLPKLQWIRKLNMPVTAAMTIVVGLSNGHAVLVKATVGKSSLEEVLVSGELDLGEDAGKGPVTCAVLSSDSLTLWLAHGQNISSFHTSKLERLSTWNSGHKSDFSRGVIRRLEALAPGSSGASLCTSAQRSDSVRLWSKEGRLLRELQCSFAVPDTVDQACQVTCLHADGRLLWVGTRSGHTLLFDLSELQLIAACHHHSYVHWIGSISSDDESSHKMARCSVLICGSPKGDGDEVRGGDGNAPGGSLFVRVDWIPG